MGESAKRELRRGVTGVGLERVPLSSTGSATTASSRAQEEEGKGGEW